MKHKVWFLIGVALLTILIGWICQEEAQADVWLPPAQYATAYTLYFGVYDSNSPWRAYETAPAAEDIHVFQDGASEARATNAVTDLGRTFKLVLTATEMTARVVTVDVNDASTVPLFGDETFYIPTYGHDSAYVPTYPADPNTSQVIDGTATLGDLYECLLAFMAGKATVTDLGATSTIAFYKQDGTTVKYNITSSDTNGSRAATGNLDP